MTFHEVLFPTSISKGAKLLSEDGAVVQRRTSGASSAVLRWPNALWSFDVGFGITGGRTFEDLRTVFEFWLRRQGRAHGFRFENPFDNTTATDGLSAPSDTDVILGTGTGTETQFQMKKLVTDTTGTTTQLITKPKDGTVVAAIDGTPLAKPADFNYDDSTGLLTLATGLLAGEVLTFGTEYDLPCKFGHKMPGLSMTLITAAGEVGRAPSIPIIEMSSESLTPDLPYMGGGSTQSFTGDLLYSFSMGQFIYLVPSTSGLSFILPSNEALPLGGPILTLKNGGTDSVDIINRTSGATEFALPAATGVNMYVTETGGSRFWHGLKGV